MNIILVICLPLIVGSIFAYVVALFHFGRRVYCSSKNRLDGKTVLITGEIVFLFKFFIELLEYRSNK